MWSLLKCTVEELQLALLNTKDLSAAQLTKCKTLSRSRTTNICSFVGTFCKKCTRLLQWPVFSMTVYMNGPFLTRFDHTELLGPPLGLVVSVRDRKQAGTGPSRRHIQGSKIAKRLPSVKYSFTVVENRFFFEKITY